MADSNGGLSECMGMMLAADGGPLHPAALYMSTCVMPCTLLAKTKNEALPTIKHTQTGSLIHARAGAESFLLSLRMLLWRASAAASRPSSDGMPAPPPAAPLPPLTLLSPPSLASWIPHTTASTGSSPSSELLDLSDAATAAAAPAGRAGYSSRSASMPSDMTTPKWVSGWVRVGGWVKSQGFCWLLCVGQGMMRADGSCCSGNAAALLLCGSWRLAVQLAIKGHGGAGNACAGPSSPYLCHWGSR